MNKSSDKQLFFDFDAPVAAAPVTETVEENSSDLLEAVEAVELSAETAATPEPVVEVVAETVPEIPAVEEARKLDRFSLLQAALAYLAQSGAAGAALQVPCRLRKFQADVAAYYSCYRKRINHLERTLVVDVYTERKQCLPESAGRGAMLDELSELREKRTAMEQSIRIDEPGLWVEEELFDEFRTFDYSRSTNKEYHKLCRRITSLQQSLYKGTRMEQLARADVADYLVMAVPENMLSEKEIPDGWGLWYIMPDKSVKVVVNPALQECSSESRLHLVQNIGHAALNCVLFANGVKLKSNNKVRFTRPPRARRK
jgi:hypothetical protein